MRKCTLWQVNHWLGISKHAHRVAMFLHSMLKYASANIWIVWYVGRVCWYIPSQRFTRQSVVGLRVYLLKAERPHLLALDHWLQTHCLVMTLICSWLVKRFSHERLDRWTDAISLIPDATRSIIDILASRYTLKGQGKIQDWDCLIISLSIYFTLGCACFDGNLYFEGMVDRSFPEWPLQDDALDCLWSFWIRNLPSRGPYFTHNNVLSNMQTWLSNAPNDHGCAYPVSPVLVHHGWDGHYHRVKISSYLVIYAE